MNSLPKKIYEKLIKHDSINDHSIFISHTKNMGDVKKRDNPIKVFYNSKRINSIRYINKFQSSFKKTRSVSSNIASYTTTNTY